MTTFTQRMLGAAVLDRRIYEEVEADSRANGQAVAIVLAAGLAGGIGLPGLPLPDPQALAVGIASALLGWVAWATLTCVIGTRFLPEPQTRADVGELTRTMAFAAAPGILRVLGAIPVIGLPIYAIASGWMVLAMIVAVRQALDYRSAGRAIAVCVVGWSLCLAAAAIIAIVFARPVS